MTERQKILSAPAIGTLPFRVIVLTMAGFLLMILVAPRRVSGAEFRIQPELSLSEEYNDNIFLTPTNREQDYISQAVPAINLVYKTDLWDWNVYGAYIYRYYLNRTLTSDETYSVDVQNKTQLIDNTLFVVLSDDYRRVSLDVTRDYTQESLSVNQSDQNVFTVNPYIIARNATRSAFVLGYQFDSTWYKNSDGVNTTEQSEYAEVTTALSSRTTFTAGARYLQNVNNVDTYDKLDIYAGPQYTYAPNSYLYIILGNSLLDFEMPGQTRVHTSQLFWNAGIKHQYSTMTVAFHTDISYIPDPLLVVRRADSYLASLIKETSRTTIEVRGGMIEYRNPATKNLEDTSYKIEGLVTYSLSPKSKVGFDVSVQRLLDYLNYSTEDLYINSLRFEHKFLEKLTLALGYEYTNVRNPEVYTSNYYNNRFTAEVKMTF